MSSREQAKIEETSLSLSLSREENSVSKVSRVMNANSCACYELKRSGCSRSIPLSRNYCLTLLSSSISKWKVKLGDRYPLEKRVWSSSYSTRKERKNLETRRNGSTRISMGFHEFRSTKNGEEQSVTSGEDNLSSAIYSMRYKSRLATRPGWRIFIRVLSIFIVEYQATYNWFQKCSSSWKYFFFHESRVV